MADDNLVTWCFRCKSKKPAGEFYKNRSNPNGLSTMCKPCLREHQKNYNNLPHVKQRIEKYRQSDHYKNRMKNYRPRGRVNQRRYEASEKGKITKKQLRTRSESYRQKIREFRKQHPERHQANQAVKRAVAKGVLINAKLCKCSKCDSPAREYHHYMGYSKQHRLTVVPLCKKCHTKETNPMAKSDAELLIEYENTKLPPDTRRQC